MFRTPSLIVSLIAAMTLGSLSVAREWSDTSGHYTVEADLVAMSDNVVMLQKPDKNLLSMKIEQLSEADREYLESKEAEDAIRDADGEFQSWTTRSGLKIRAKVVAFARKDVTIQRRRGKIYVNDKLYDNLPGVYREMVPRIVGHFESLDIQDKKGLENWAKKLKAEPKTFSCEGVLMELETGDLYGVPFFFLSEEDRKFLEPGWERWLAAEDDRLAQERQALEFEARARESQRDREAMRQYMELQLFLEGYDAGLFDLWEVSLFPTNSRDSGLMVVVPGRNSQQAAAEAKKRYPNHNVGPIAKVRRKR